MHLKIFHPNLRVICMRKKKIRKVQWVYRLPFLQIIFVVNFNSK